MSLLDRTLYHNTLADWAIALALGASALTVACVIRHIVLRRISRYARQTETRIDDIIVQMLSSTHSLFLLVLSLYLAAQYLNLPAKMARVVEAVAIITLLLQAALWLNRGIAAALAHYLRTRREADAAGATTADVLGFIARVAVWAVITLMILDNLGVNITALVASLGIGGIAVALAVQNIMGDIFASLSIALDQPFAIGDFIVVDDVFGTVEHIGLKTTRIRSLSGEQIVFANADLLKSRVRNYKRMNERRVVFSFGVVYQTAHDRLARVPAMVREIVGQQQRARFDRAHFWRFGESSLDFEVVYHVLDSDYNVYMDIQQAINLAIFRRLGDEGIEFAYPTRTLYVEPGVPAAQAGGGAP